MHSDTSAFLLDLYRASRRLNHSEFRPWVFEELRKIIYFDSAFWYRWAAQVEKSYIHAWYLYRQPESLLQEYVSGELWKEDIIYERAVNGPRGKAVYASFNDYTGARMRAFLKRHHQEQVLTIALIPEVPQIAAGVSLYRDDTRGTYTTDDAQAIESVTPHVIDAWRENWLSEIVRRRDSRCEPPEFSLAVVMPELMMSEAQDNFGRLMHAEFPGWQGPWLPEALARHLRASEEAWTGQSITVYQRLQADQTRLLLVRKGHRLDHLAPRKKAVARLFARGSSQTQVAEKLNLSASTVNNYLGDIYQQLDIADKVELSKLVARLEP
jgi:DNA-binding CsgD family transcriptional regulator